MSDNQAFLQSIRAFVDKAKMDQQYIVRAGAIKILAQLVQMSPVGNPELWEVNQTASDYNDAVFEHNENLRNDPANLTTTGRVKKKAKVVHDSMDIKAPPGYTGGRFRGNWQVSFDEPTTEETGAVDKSGRQTIANGNFVIEQFKIGVNAIYFCNNVPYSYSLEMGHSTQAPNGMVRVTAIDAAQLFR